MSIEIEQKKQIMSVLDQLKAVTTIVADTGDFEGIIIVKTKINVRLSAVKIIKKNFKNK